MKTRFLFPHGYRKLGYVAFLIGAIAYLAMICFNTEISEYEVILRNKGNLIPFDIILTDVILVSLITGLLLIAFSKEPVEDEQIAQLRLDCLQWAIYFNYALMLICVLVFNGANFLAVMIYNILTPLAFFIIRFRWKMYQSNTLLIKQGSAS